VRIAREGKRAAAVGSVYHHSRTGRPAERGGGRERRRKERRERGSQCLSYGRDPFFFAEILREGGRKGEREREREGGLTSAVQPRPAHGLTMCGVHDL